MPRGCPGSRRRSGAIFAMALTEAVDRAIFNWATGANRQDLPATCTGLQTDAPSPKCTLTQANKLKPSNTVARFAGMIDGRHAASSGGSADCGDGRGQHALDVHHREQRGGEPDACPIPARHSGLVLGRPGRDRGRHEAGWGTSARLWAGLGASHGAGVAPVWDASNPDPGSVQRRRRRARSALTLSYLWSFGLPRASNFQRLKFVA